MKGYAPRLALIKRYKATRKWPIEIAVYSLAPRRSRLGQTGTVSRDVTKETRRERLANIANTKILQNTEKFRRDRVLQLNMT